MSYTAKVIAVLGRTLRAGRWKLADDSLVIAVFGRCVLDLSRAYVDEDDDELSMTVFALFGSVSILLPAGCDVEPSGIAILASSEVEIPSEKVEDVTLEVLAPLDISWFAMFGRVRINELSLEPEPEPEPEPEVEVGSTLPPPAVDVFDATEAAVAPPAPSAAVAESGGPQTSVADTGGPQTDEAAAAAAAASEQAALRDEIAQWRTETGRPEPGAETAAEAEILPDEDSEVDADVASDEESAADVASDAEPVEAS